MQINFDDAQAWAAATLREVAMDGDDAPDPRRVAKRLSITIVSAPARSILGGFGQMGRFGDGWLIRRAVGLPLPALLFTVAHELGHIAVRRYGLRVQDEDPWANAFAGALLLPRDPLRLAWRKGGDLGDVVERWPNVAPTCAALRLGETGLAGTAVIQGRALRYIRMEAEPSQDLIALGVEAARAGRAMRPGIAKAWRMVDAPRRAAVVVEAIG
jgi:hypothetical protein